jgi:phosphopantothenoylcysteine decarboxylase/phosphopantothenate--cysteine ligase
MVKTMIVLCVTGSVAAVETIKLAREFRRQNFDLYPFLSENGKKIIHPNALEFACQRSVITDITGMIEHIKYASADLILVAPATANIISKFNAKIADDPISALLISAQGHQTPILFVPAMHETMYKTIAKNIKELKSEGIHFFEPKLEEEHAKFPDKQDIILESLKLLSNNDLTGKNIIITLGRTHENIDPVRTISNKSTGKMGLELIKEGYKRGANLTVISGKVDVKLPKMINVIYADTNKQMSEEIKKHVKDNDILISTAAVSDFIPVVSNKKISSKTAISIDFTPAEKIIENIKKLNPNIFLVGFKAEYNLSDEKLIKKGKRQIDESGSDLVLINDTGKENSEFGSDSNYAILIDKNDTEQFGTISKRELSTKIFNKIIAIYDN